MPKNSQPEEPQVGQPTTAEWFAELDRLGELAGEPFMPDGREQPEMPPDREIFGAEQCADL